MKYLIFCLPLILLMGCPASEQAGQTSSRTYKSYPDWQADDLVYDSYIRTVQLYKGEYEQAFPMLYLGETQPLILEFDDLIPEDQREADYYVDIINCDANWKPSTLLPIEFYEGFTQERVDFYERSRFTKVPYVHYMHMFPQENEYFKKSGNYLLKVFRNNDPRDVVLTRRFVVVDQRIGIELKYLLNDRVERLRMENFAFDIITGNMRITDPSFDLNVKVLQNFRWDNASTIQRPRVFGDNRFEYMVRMNQDFIGGNEFRRLDLRSVRLFSEAVQDIQEDSTVYRVELFADKPRDFNVFSSQRDRNGTFMVEVFESPEFDTESDYLSVHFRLLMPEPVASGEVYVFGSMTDWQAKAEFRMNWNAEFGYYECAPLLKQGLYDFSYVVQKPDGTIDDQELEGQHTETENFYTILVYFREPADRSDQLIGFMPVNYYD